MLFHAIESYPKLNPVLLKPLREKWHKIFLHWHDVIKEKIQWIILCDAESISLKTILEYPNLKYVCIIWNKKINNDFIIDYIQKNKINLIYELDNILKISM